MSSVASKKIKLGRSDKIFYAVVYSVVIFLTILVLYPIVFVVSASLSSSTAVAQGKVWLWPVDFSLAAYKAVLNYKDLWIGYRNTIFYVVVGTTMNVATAMICAYPMARKGLPGRNVLSFFFSFTMLFGGGMVPSYILVKNLGLMNSVWSQIIPGLMSVYNMIVARTFIQSNIPEEMLEASKIDGCDDFKFFFKMVLPLSKAIIAVMVLRHAVGHWNSYFGAMLYLTDKELYPLQTFLREILVQNEMDLDTLGVQEAIEMQNLKMLLKYAVIVVSTVPLYIFYPLAQKHFAKGVMVGSVKG